MAQEITIRRDDGFAVTERSSNNLIKGILAKFKKGTFLANKTEILKQAPDGPAYLVEGTVTAWVEWRNKRPVAHKITHTGQLHPYREDFDDLDESKWERAPDGSPSDPHRDTRYTYLVNLQSGKTYTLIGDSVGMRQAVGELKDAIATVRLARPHAHPIVQLATGSMPTKHGAAVARPDFRIIDWRDGTPPAPAETLQQIEDFPDYDADTSFGKRNPF
jgi:hypothetical protein